MLPILISVSLFAVLTGLIVWYGYRAYARPGQTYEQLSTPLTGSMLGTGVPSLSSGSAGYNVRRILQWAGEKVPMDPMVASITRRQLSAAGFRSDAALPIFMAVRILAAITAVACVMVTARFTTWSTTVEFIIWCVAGFLGYLLSGLVLDLLIDRYHDILRCSLPDALDLLVVAVEAGLGLDQALRKVSDELASTHPEICREFALVCLEMRTGTKRADALRNMAERTMEKEIRKFVAIMVQTDKFGTSIAESLRTHADFMRVRRKQLAEEKANKLGVKLTIVVFFFILPSIMIIAGGPAILRIFKLLLPAMRSIGN